MRKYFTVSIILFLSAIAVLASRKDEITLLLIPREDSAVRVGMDVANRYPTLLISYQVKANGAVSLHGWSGSEWVNISQKDFNAGNFFRKGPDSALVIEKVNAEMSDLLIPSEEWCATVCKITTTEPRALIHLIGRHFDFGYKDWQWFSKNYGFPLDAINPEGLNVSWYHKRLDEHLQKRAIGADDLQFWVPIRQVVDVKPEEAVAEEGLVPVIDQPEMETPEDPDIADPFVNEAPVAVVLGASDAEEAGVAE
ncbi:MAG TPA: hypothetical protein VIR63_01815 [Pontiella sp.]